MPKSRDTSYSGDKPSNPRFSSNASLLEKLEERIKWLFTKDGRPILLVIIVGFVVGAFVDGAVGVILSTIVGLIILSFLKKWHLPTKPWQATVSTLFPIIARLCFIMILLLPVASDTVGLLLPSGHYPTTLMKYLSIMVVVPKNIISNAPAADIFPGIPLVVALSVVLMFWGSLNLYKRKNFIIAFAGLILYTISPIIASAAVPTHFTPEYSYAIGYYLGWVGIVLVIVDKFFLHRILKMPTPQTTSPAVQSANRLMSIMPFFGIALFLTQLQVFHFNIHLTVFQDMSPGFEEAHHALAEVFTGVVAGIGAGAMVDGISSDDSSSNPPDQPTQPDSPPVPPTSPDIPPPPPTPPADEPPDIDEIKQKLEQEKINQQYQAANDKDWNKSINDDVTKAANDDKALHDMQDHVHDETKKFWKQYYTDENEFNSWEAEHQLKNAENMETLENAAKYTKKGADWAIWVGKFTVPGGKQLSDAYEVTSNFAEGASEDGIVRGLEKGGLKAGEKLLEHVGMHQLEHSLGPDSAAGQFVHYVNEEGGPASSLGEFAVEATKDKMRGAVPEGIEEWTKKKTGLEGSE